MKKYKVLHITNGADVGGISAVILNYYRNIDRSQFQFDFVVPPCVLGPNGHELENLGGTFYTLPLKNEHPISFMKDLSKLIKQNHYDIVHAHHHDTSFVALFVAMFCGVKCRVAQSHSYRAEGGNLKIKFRRYVGVLLNDLSSNLRFACTNEAASYLFGKWLKHLFPVTIIRNGIEPERFPYSIQARTIARKELNINNSTLVFGIVARMTPEKNHVFLLKVLKDIKKLRKDVKLLIVGDGPLRDELREYACKESIDDDVIFAGKRPDLVNMLCAMDVFTLPSIYEGSPVSAVEASANGLPVVLSSSITKDLQFLSNVAYVDINDNCCGKWAETIIKLSNKGRDEQAVTVINNKGYNVSSITKLLAESYLNKIHKR